VRAAGRLAGLEAPAVIRARSLVLLALSVAGLGLFTWWQRSREIRQAAAQDRALLPGLDATRVRALRVEYLDRDLHLRLERAPSGRWMLVDPISFPANAAVTAKLLEILCTNRAEPAGAGTPEQMGLEPPQAIIEVEEEVAGRVILRRLELGAVEVGGEQVIVRVEGLPLRTSRNLANTIERNLPDWRNRALLEFAPEQLVGLRRSGSLETDGVKVALDLELSREERWRALVPARVSLDPARVADFVVALLGLEASAFVDEPLADLAAMGLDPPRLRIELELADGSRQALRLSPSSHAGTWLAAREGTRQYYRLQPERVNPLLVTSADLYDRALVRAPQQRVTALRLVRGGVETLIERDKLSWSVREQRGGQRSFGPEPAEADLVLDLLGLLERARLYEYAPAPHAPFRPREPALEFWIEADGARWGGRLGDDVTTADGAKGVWFLREGDLLPALVDPALAQRLALDGADLRSKELHRQSELELVQIHLERAGAKRVYARNETGQWSREGTAAPASAFELLVDRLLSERAEALPRAQITPALEPAVTVELFSAVGSRLRYSLARPASGPERERGWAYYQGPKGRSAWVDGALLAELERLLAQ
jgi:hypothetical protein